MEFYHLPVDILQYICSYLNLSDLISFAKCCKRTYQGAHRTSLLYKCQFLAINHRNDKYEFSNNTLKKGDVNIKTRYVDSGYNVGGLEEFHFTCVDAINVSARGYGKPAAIRIPKSATPTKVNWNPHLSEVGLDVPDAMNLWLNLIPDKEYSTKQQQSLFSGTRIIANSLYFNKLEGICIPILWNENEVGEAVVDLYLGKGQVLMGSTFMPAKINDVAGTTSSWDKYNIDIKEITINIPRSMFVGDLVTAVGNKKCKIWNCNNPHQLQKRQKKN